MPAKGLLSEPTPASRQAHPPSHHRALQAGQRADSTVHWKGPKGGVRVGFNVPMLGLRQDVQGAVRLVRRNPGTSLVIVLTLGLGIGANAAIFSAVHALLLRPSPFADPERLVRIASIRGDEEGPLSVPELDDLKALPAIVDAAMYTDQGMYNASGFGTPEELPATITTYNLFSVLGVELLVGSTFPAHYDRSRQFGLVISHGLWTRRFGRDPNVVGRTMTLDGAPGYVIHGVLPAGFNFPSHSDVFRSSGIAADPKSYERRDIRARLVLARLAPGISVEQARSAIDVLARRLEREFPQTNAGLRFRVTPLHEMYTGAVRPYVLLLFGAVLLVLIVACANVANLLLSRAIARHREIAIRAALGASRSRLVRQLLVESLFLSALGGIAGWGLAVAGVHLLTAMIPAQLPPWMQIGVDGRVGLFLAVVCALTGLAAGLVPAWRSGVADVHASLKEGSRGSSSGVRHHQLRNALVIAEVALALVLLVGAGLLTQSVRRLQQVDLGFDPNRLLTFRVELGWAAYGTLEKTTTFHRRVLERLSALPGVRAVTFDTNLPMSGKPRDAQAVRLFGQSPDQEAQNPYANLHQIGPAYFATMGISMRSGREFSEMDRPVSVPAAIVSRRLADRLWPGQEPLGQRLQFSDTAQPDTWLTVVGVSESVLHHELDGEPGLDLYRPFTQSSTAGPYYVLRTNGDPQVLANAATAIIGATDPNQSFLDVQMMEARLANRMWQRRLSGALFGSFAGLALILAAIGLYGVLSYLVTQQTREIGVRLALGAAPRAVMGMVVRRGLTLAVAGVSIGLVLAFGLARLVAGLLYEVSPGDPLTFAGVTVGLLAIVVLASVLPARRAMRVDPIIALRAE
jgi:putative ABC transport system permease protein